MAHKVTVTLPSGEETWVKVSHKAREAVVEYAAKNPDLSFAEASQAVLGLDISQSVTDDDESGE